MDSIGNGDGSSGSAARKEAPPASTRDIFRAIRMGDGSWKRDPNTFKNEDLKHCNCKISKCLKLYCECFRAGEYCAEGCDCQGCSNKPDYEDKVRTAQQMLISRCPLAFIPNNVQHAIESPQNSGSGELKEKLKDINSNQEKAG
ncbi:CRC domain-containing protein [Cinnamomum micranthum f. kanehirae]|uniref:CRC domain-containing protein n=1 Tax=Cinnamomum micranthum f. kanehirae TaxID=337451 RepID=A0A3S3MJW9_9MAGN|nr:CRC domain-containing protein [Cinnamomum micranthum f. kanehirae]